MSAVGSTSLYLIESCFVSGKWTVQQAAEMSVAAPTIEASLDGRFVSGLKDERVKAAKFYEQFGVKAPSQLVRPVYATITVCRLSIGLKAISSPTCFSVVTSALTWDQQLGSVV